MKSPASNSVSIRLEINVPVGVCVTGGPPAVGRGKPDVRRLFKNPQPPDDEDGEWPVLPDPTTGLGTICGQVDFDDPQFMVWAAVYPDAFFPDDPPPPPTFPLAGWAVEGTGSNNGRRWMWGQSNPVGWGAHSDDGAPNKFAIWYQTHDVAGPTDPPDIVFDGATSFSGVSDETPCGGGSGSDVDTLDPTLACAPVVEVVITEGCNTGHYPAARVGRRKWRATIGGAAYSISATRGGGFTIRGPSKSITCKASGAGPFWATFCGRMFGSSRDVVVKVPAVPPK